MRYDAAIFDLDGLLLDTERIAIVAGYRALADLGLPRTDGLFEGLVGKDNATGARALVSHYGEDFPIERFGSRWDGLFLAALEEGIPLRPGATDLLDRLEALGLPRAVATSSQRKSADHKLSKTGLHRYFGAVVTVNCVTRPKPAPDPYLLAASRLGHRPERCIAFEDSDTGAAAAKAAGMVVVQVPDMQATDGRHAHHLAESLLDGARAAGLI
ncbi:HAD family phosphatase [Frigidibacter sp. SD6-1]|uniref:HAD family hydrolase n=1 Tax=Frigidibacter sp. SD6-1 TaxID=3032581 RepID=UPI0024E00CAA|nr:HAD family phosphatase [Frigidibacter sp. SD6-1]